MNGAGVSGQTAGLGLPAHLVPPTPGTPRPQLGWLAARRGPRELARIRALLPGVLAQLSEQHGVACRDWLASPGTWTSTGTATFQLGPAPGEPAALLRLSPSGRQRFQRESEVLGQLTRGSTAVLPRRLAAGTAHGCPFVLDAFIPGRSAAALVGDARWPSVQGAALAAINGMHREFGRPMIVGEDALRHWVDAPLAVLRRRISRLPGVSLSSRLDRLGELLTNSLAGRKLDATWVHGDFWAGNLLVDETTSDLTGIVDWDLAAPRELPVHDYLHLLVYRRRERSGRNLGDVVCDLLRERDGWSTEERTALAGADWCFHEDPPPGRVLLLLHWLRHVAAVSVHQRSYVNHSVLVWELRNVHQVLRALPGRSRQLL